MLAAGGTIGEAAAHAEVGRSAIYDWKADDPEFARELEQAYEAGTDRYEAEARRRAFTGSDALLIFLLKQRDPRRFNQRMLMVAGDPENPIGIHHTRQDVTALARAHTVDAIEALVAALAAGKRSGRAMARCAAVVPR